MKHVLQILVYTTLLFYSSPLLAKSTEAEIIENKATLPILTPSYKEQKVLKLKLTNGLQVYLVSDPTLEKSSAAMTVKAGSWEDPKDHPGIAHFLEHMLFLGTKKYPVESEFDRFLSENGGTFNAFTAPDFTSYMFAVDNKAFNESLDRFSGFFTDPLFNPSGVDRELNAIDQEYAKNVENDDIREYYVFKHLGNPDHPNHGFSMGNKKSLTEVSQETLKKWYKEHYSANRMRLTVISNQSIEQLKDLVIADFSQIPNYNIPPFAIDVPVYGDAMKGKMIYIEPVKNIRRLSLTWELPSKFVDMRDTKPDSILCQILGHEGDMSLLADLKKAKLADELSCGGSRTGGKQAEFSIGIVLTDAGVKNVDEVILKVFQAINNLKEQGIPQYIFDEIHSMGIINYQYQPKEEEFEHIMKEAIMSANEDLSTYPEQSYILQKYDPKATKEMLQYLTPENGIYDLIAPKNLTGINPDQEEPWLKVSYTVKEIPKEKLAQWSHAEAVPDIGLPEANKFIPEKLNTLSAPKSTQGDNLLPIPSLVMNNDSGKVFFSQDTQYMVPQISWILQIKTPAINAADIDSIVLGDLFIKSANEILSRYTYPASLAGLDFSLKREDNGFSLKIEGYSDKAAVLFQELIKGLKNIQPREQKFKTYKDILLRQYQDASLDLPLAQAAQNLRSIIYKNFVTEKAKAVAIRRITFEQWEKFLASLFTKTYIEGMLYGNMTEKQAKQWTSQLQDTLGSAPYLKKDHLVKEVINLPDNRGPYFLDGKTKSQGNGAILAIEMLPFSFKARAAQQILMLGMKQPFFVTLRTKQQTGYIVYNQAEETEKHLFNLFAVQSNSHEGRDLIARFELFIESFMQELTKTEIPEERFENIRHTLVSNLKQPPKSIAEMGEALNNLAFNYDNDFQWLNKRVKGFEELTYDEFIELSRQMMNKSNKRRLAVVVSGVLQDHNAILYKRAASVAQIRKMGTYSGSN